MVMDVNFGNPLKKLFIEQNIRASSWKQIDTSIVKKLMDIPELDGLGNIILINHFLRQQVRIPTQEEPSLRRIMQVALNSGQFLASHDVVNDLKNFNYDCSDLDRLSNLHSGS